MEKRVFILFLTIALVHVIGGKAAALDAFGDKIDLSFSIQQTLNVKTHEGSRDIRYNSFRTTLRPELVYKLKESSTWNIKFYGLAAYFYDFALDIDSPMRHSIRSEAGSRSNYKDAQRPRDSEEWLKELYVEIGYGNVFNMRLGKQIVSWGETAEEQVADLINPMDVKYAVAFPAWEDYKLGLWMARLFYTPPGAWQDLAFELIVIPFNFVETRLPVAGHGFFAGNSTTAPFNLILSRIRRDCPSETFKNLELGLRIKGYSNLWEGIDWSVSHFYSRQDTPVAAGSDGSKGYGNFILAALNLPFLQPTGAVFEYPFFHSTAFSFSTTWNKPKLLIRGESTYNSNKTYHYGTGGPIAPNTKDKDLITTSLSVKRYVELPVVSGAWNRHTPVAMTVAWYNYWMLNHEYDKESGNYIMGDTGRDSTKTKMTFNVTAFFLNYQLVTDFYGAYNANGGTMGLIRIVLQPTNSWTYVLAYQQFNEDYQPDGLGRYNNQVIFSAKYDF